MQLSFSTKINGKANYFIEKTHASLSKADIVNDLGCPEFYAYHEYFEYQYRHQFNHLDWDKHPEHLEALRDGFDEYSYSPKRHTIRKDEKNRWKAGVNIHPVIKPKGRFSAGFQFAPVIKCKSVQIILISYEEAKPNVYVDGFPFYFHTRRNTFGEDKMNLLAVNDGFDNLGDFFAYFNTDLTGKIIHWTDLRY